MRERTIRVLDSTPLIGLASSGVLERAIVRGRNYLITPEVQSEVVEAGRRGGHPDSERIHALVESKVIAVRTAADDELIDRILVNPRLSRADASTIALAVQEKARLFTDEKDMREVGKRLGVRLGGSLSLLAEAVDEGRISSVEAVSAVERMIAAGWYCSPPLFKRFADVMALRSR
ncbi:MAG TPA: DUF3368 domain-containing protein [Thermoplasmata archaeon]|nr:DUF3368 domain-containing protein [Thermoplasmata archaeon]